MTTELAVRDAGLTFTESQIDLIKRTVAQGASEQEFELFVYTAQVRGLNPLAGQICCIVRNDKRSPTGKKATFQTTIDGYRLIADRTGCYAPGKAATFDYDADGKLIAATAYVMKWVKGTWMEVSETAHFAEYVQLDYNTRQPTGLWADKPHVMTSKCAEGKALRRAFPQDLSGLYNQEEMPQDDVAAAVPHAPITDTVPPSDEQRPALQQQPRPPQQPPQQPRPQPAARQSAPSGNVSCPICGGEMYDQAKSKFWNNGISDKTGKQKPTHKCKNKDCTGVVWPADDAAQAPPAVEPATAEAKLAPGARPAIHGNKWTRFVQDAEGWGWDSPEGFRKTFLIDAALQTGFDLAEINDNNFQTFYDCCYAFFTPAQ